MKFISHLTSLFGENQCFGCGKSGHFFCLQCNSNLELYSPYCYVCKKPSSNFRVHKACQSYFPTRQVIVLTRYRNKAVKKLMRHAKYYGKYGAYRDLTHHNRDFFKEFIEFDNSILIPVPMHFLRRWKRGYNQSEKIAQNLSVVLDIPTENNFIKRCRYTKQQSHLSAVDRAKNLSGVFSLKNMDIVDKNSTIYLVDDVISTGSTVLEITNLLHRNGYKRVSMIALASD